jgi:UDP-N-acetylglucosamine 4,6-dehydratase
LDDAVDRVLEVLKIMQGGEVFCPKMPSVKMIDVAKRIANAPSGGQWAKKVDIRQGEKLHEHMIIQEDAPKTYELDNFFITTQIYRGKGKKVPLNFSYTSDENWDWMDASSLTN